MNPLTASEINQLLEAAGSGSVVYLIGIGGCGMSGLGHLLLDLGHRVVGSDLLMNQDIQQLRQRGAQIQIGHAPELLHETRPALVVYSSAIRLNNPEMMAAQELNIPMVRRAALLAALMSRQLGICVAGMHGKTTTTALLAFALEHLHGTPSYAVGAQVPQLEPHARFQTMHGQTVDNLPYFIVEADESDGTLREFNPHHAIVLNVDEEHLDYYANLEAVCREFKTFAAQTSGHLVFCADDPQLARLYSDQPGAISVGFHPLATYHIRNFKDGGSTMAGSLFEIWRGGELLGEFALSLIGEKNASNAAAVIALLHLLGYPPSDIARAIGPFKGASRRQQELFRDRRFRVFDDYGHHPQEIRATLRALKALGSRRLLVAFQPHRYTRTQHLLHEFTSCFDDADKLWITEVYAANEPEIPGVNGTRLAESIRVRGRNVTFVPVLNELRGVVRAEMQPGDLVLFIGAGDITLVSHELADQLGYEKSEVREEIYTQLTTLLSPTTVVKRDESLARRTTLKVGGKADYYVEPASELELSQLLKFCAANHLPFFLLGRGSNLLIRDGGIRGVAICLKHAAFSHLDVQGDKLFCGAGTRLKDIAVEARRRGLAGLEFLEGIPGSLGGALRMNAGAMGSWMFEWVESVRFMDHAGLIFELPAGDLVVEYRGCPFFKTHIALAAVLKAQPAPREVIDQRAKELNHKRWESQPAQPSAGCIFKNPQTIPAGKLIDELGLKKTKIGGAMVSDIHGNFIVNDGQATAKDVLELIEHIKQTAKAQRGIDLHTEVEIIGENA